LSECGEDFIEEGEGGMEWRGCGREWRGEGPQDGVLCGEEWGKDIKEVIVQSFEARQLG